MRYFTAIYIVALVAAVYAGWLALGAFAPALRRPTPEVSAAHPTLRIPILIYHSVVPDYPGETDEQKAFAVTPDQFESQLRYLHEHGFTPVSMDAVSTYLHDGTSYAIAKPVAITFDDGWHNQYEYAFPLLKKYGDIATFYIYSNPIDHQHPNFMSWDQIKNLRAAGMTIGSHTLTHPYLSTLSAQQLTHEVVDSKAVIEERLGISVHHFASPFGYTSPVLVALLDTADYETGRTTWPGAAHSWNDRLALSGFLVHRSIREFVWTLERAR